MNAIIDDLGPVPIVNPELLPLGFDVMHRHFKAVDADMVMTSNLADVLDDLLDGLGLDGETTVAVFRRVCAGLNYLAVRQELDGLAPPAKPFSDPIFCAAASRCPVVHDAPGVDQPGADTFDPGEFEPSLEQETKRQTGHPGLAPPS
jgi:hypothetical protein